ncbi:MAG: hypothetical protein NTY77_10570 [Elusimicrobia bacterium]|nr:hypothetical protein [Elusimicrobiota bacterium]
MRLLRKIMLFACGVLALINLVGLVLDLVTLHWLGAGWALLRAAGWAAVCVYLIRLDRRVSAPPPEEP